MNNKVQRIPRRPIYPTPAGLIVSVDARGKPNLDDDKVNSNGERDESKLDPLIWLGHGFYKLGVEIGEMK